MIWNDDYEIPTYSQIRGSVTSEANFTPQGCVVRYAGKAFKYSCKCTHLRHYFGTHAKWFTHYKDNFAGPIRYECYCCARDFPNLRSVAQHNRHGCNILFQGMHWPDPHDHQCPECVYRARNKRGLSRHVYSKHPLVVFNKFRHKRLVDRRWTSDESKILAKQVMKDLKQFNLTLEQTNIGYIRESYAKCKHRICKSWKHVQRFIITERFKRQLSTITRKASTKKNCVTPSLSQSVSVGDQGETCNCSNDIREYIKSQWDCLNPFITNRRERQLLKRDLHPRPLNCSQKLLESIYYEHGEESDERPKRQRAHADGPRRCSRESIGEVQLLKKLGSKGYLSHLCNPELRDLSPSEGAIDWFKGQFERPSIEDNEDVIAIDRPTDISTCTIHGLISEDEMLYHLSKFDPNTASGCDKFSVANLKSVPSAILAMLMNMFILAGDVPFALKQNRTTLLAKKPNPGDQDWRPITVSSTVYRLFSKIITSRLTMNVSLSPQQRAFLSDIDGCKENISVVTTLIQRANAGYGTLMVCSIDLAKAFDSVSFSSILRTLRRHKIDERSLNLVSNLLENNSTEIAKAKRAKILRGVRQGDPISPLLFNLVIDELFGLLKESRYGASYLKRDGTLSRISAVAFADDITLLSDTQRSLEKLLSTTRKFFERRGMRININKSSCLAIGRVPKTDVLTPIPITVWVRNAEGDKELLPCLGPNDELRVLGAYISPLGKAEFKMERLCESLDAIANSPLDAFHKVSVIRQHIVNSFKYQVVYGGVRVTTAHQADGVIRKCLRRILKLPPHAADVFFKLPYSHGGLGIESLADAATFLRMKQQLTLLNSDREATRELVSVTKLKDGYLRCNMLAGRQEDFDNPVYWDTDEEDYLTQRLLQIDVDEWYSDCRKRRLKLDLCTMYEFAQGKAFHQLVNAPHGYLTEPEKYGFEFGKIQLAYAIRLGTLTVLSNSRHSIESRTCRLCQHALETPGHVLQECTETKRWRIERHNAVAAHVYLELQNQSRGDQLGVMAKEPTLVCQSPELVRLSPDLMILSPKSSAQARVKVAIIDISCSYEYNETSLRAAYGRKRWKYEILKNWLPLNDNLEMLEQYLGNCEGELQMDNAPYIPQCQRDKHSLIRVFPFIVGTRGGWFKKNMELFKFLGIKASLEFENHVMRTATERSINIFKKFMGKVRSRND